MKRLRILYTWLCVPSAAVIRARNLEEARRQLEAAEFHAEHWRGMAAMLKQRIKRLEGNAND